MLAAMFVAACLQRGAPSALSAGDRAEATLEVARVLARQGLLHDTEATLAGLPSTATDEQRAHAELLLGNVAYERCRYEDALARYERAAALIGDAQAPTITAARTLEAARGNAAMARMHVERRGSLGASVRGLQRWIVATIVAAAVVVATLARRARRA